MPLYGDPDEIKALLRATEGATFNADQEARIVDLHKLVSARIEQETGAQFGVSVAETVVIEDAEPDTVLFLPKGVRSLTSVTEAPEWSGSAWSGGTPLTTADYRLTGKRTVAGASFYRSITHMTGSWSGLLVIVGVWEDQYPTPVPTDIDYVANYLAAELYKIQKASPAGFQGPDGATIPIRDPWKQAEVKRVLAHYRVGPMWMAA